MKEAIAKGYQKSQSRSRARARARDFLGKRGSQSRATFFSMSKREPRAEPLKKWPGSPSLVTNTISLYKLPNVLILS